MVDIIMSNPLSSIALFMFISIFLYTTIKVIFILANMSLKYMIKIIDTAKDDTKLRNNILSCIYFVGDMGPNISSVAIVAIFIWDESNNAVNLTGVFIVGIIIKRLSRTIREKFYLRINNGKDVK